jgi:hypothetical protein
MNTTVVLRRFFIGREIGLDRFEAVTRERPMEFPWEEDSVATRNRSRMSVTTVWLNYRGV